jgi:hypothetical protein
MPAVSCLAQGYFLNIIPGKDSCRIATQPARCAISATATLVFAMLAGSVVRPYCEDMTVPWVPSKGGAHEGVTIAVPQTVGFPRRL